MTKLYAGGGVVGDPGDIRGVHETDLHNLDFVADLRARPPTPPRLPTPVVLRSRHELKRNWNRVAGGGGGVVGARCAGGYTVPRGIPLTATGATIGVSSRA